MDVALLTPTCSPFGAQRQSRSPSLAAGTHPLQMPDKLQPQGPESNTILLRSPKEPPEEDRQLLVMPWAGRAGSSGTKCILLALVPRLWSTPRSISLCACHAVATSAATRSCSISLGGQHKPRSLGERVFFCPHQPSDARRRGRKNGGCNSKGFSPCPEPNT